MQNLQIKKSSIQRNSTSLKEMRQKYGEKSSVLPTKITVNKTDISTKILI